MMAILRILSLKMSSPYGQSDSRHPQPCYYFTMRVRGGELGPRLRWLTAPVANRGARLVGAPLTNGVAGVRPQPPNGRDLVLHLAALVRRQVTRSSRRFHLVWAQPVPRTCALLPSQPVGLR